MNLARGRDERLAGRDLGRDPVGLGDCFGVEAQHLPKFSREGVKSHDSIKSTEGASTSRLAKVKASKVTDESLLLNDSTFV